MADVAVVGAGIIGQLTALALSDRGLTVIQIDAGPACPPASWAGGGILSALFPWRYPDALSALTGDAFERYRALSERIIAMGGPDPEVFRSGMHVHAGAERVRALEWAERRGVSAREVAAVETPLQRGGVVAFPDVGSVRNPRLLKGLARLLSREGIEPCRAVVRQLAKEGNGWRIETDGGLRHAERVVIAAGAWSAPLVAHLGVSLPLMPVQGEMLLFPPVVPAPRQILLAAEGYVIPRADGHMLVGSTLRPGSDDQRPTAVACKQLHVAAASLWPPLQGIEPVAQWAGVRPGSHRTWPWLGELPGAPGVFLAAGHYRNGLVSAPASAELLANLICGEKPFIDPTPYSVSSSSLSPP
ncbi:NAD(P)/FAD-dependent oxidoreductase [Isoalcanivorax indicus]|uniref:NAD(P)/FAD-dependent oxidoreductase n=1 Tax=Isoalcanivorax indicus TaxID=2202653 RepID=UPI000DB9FA90|nr:FAD-dependent oxidoreductase [Isoalcanivorax indicus]